FYDGQIVAYACVRAHWTDVGGKDPGYILDSTSIHQEGLMMPGIKIFRRDEPNEDVLRIMRANSRAPITIMGDLNAEVASLRVGCQRVEELYTKYGEATVEGAIERFLDIGERQALEAIKKLPNGTWAAENWMDNDGVDDNLVRVAVSVTIDDTSITIDFSDSDDAVRGPINLAIGMTHSTSRIAFKSVTTPEEPSNSGQFRPLKIIAPEGNLFHAVYPSPVFTIWAAVVGMETIYKALSGALPELMPAGSGGDLGDPGFYGIEPYTKRQVWHQTNAGVGWGARHDADGLNTLHHFSMGTLKNVPVEVIEARLPVFVDRAGLRQDSGGAGEFRGGLGSVRDYRFLSPFGALTIVKKSRTEGWGMAGGKPGPKNLTILKPNPDDAGWRERWDRDVIVYADNDDVWGNTDPLQKHCGMFRGEFGAGDIISYLADGGGGYGEAFARDPERVREDVIDGYVSAEAARTEYGVALTAANEIDWDETKRLRG
ncbi:MAG: hydantoinase B/oxoprolinase family protein, partial [Alphaproteobacteria bacterium]|nr:hydantoinase B/oxoprolinase family protein [Alphaproteobacteria bacterium]